MNETEKEFALSKISQALEKTVDLDLKDPVAKKMMLDLLLRQFEGLLLQKDAELLDAIFKKENKNE